MRNLFRILFELKFDTPVRCSDSELLKAFEPLVKTTTRTRLFRPYTISVPFEKNDEFINNSVPFVKDSVPFLKDSVPFIKNSVPFINNSVPKILYRTRCQIFNRIRIKRKAVNQIC